MTRGFIGGPVPAPEQTRPDRRGRSDASQTNCSRLAIVRFQCSNCMGVVAIDDSEAGHAVGCGHCGSIILVPQSRISSGAIIDDFVLEKEIGQGGLATVYLAHQMSLDRPAAVKILRDQYASNRTFIANFVKEARSAAQLNHPNIVQAYAVGEEDHIHFFAMEYVQGTSLKHVLAHSGRLVPERALAIIQVIAQALAFAWEKKRLVHLDIKPDNIILTEAGETKLADLGLAKIGGDIRRQENQTSEVFGTPQYISPELLTGSATDNRTDIYSLGATLYHAVTGRYPFNGRTASEIARKHITEPLEPARKVSPDVPQPVSDLIDIMMAKRPGHRWQTADEVVAEIDRVKAGKEPSRKPLPAFQVPLKLEKIEDDLSATLEDAAGQEQPGGGKKLNLRGGGVKLRAATGKGGASQLSGKGAAPAFGKPSSPAKAGDGAAKSGGPPPVVKVVGMAEDDARSVPPEPPPPPPAKPSRPPRRKKKLSAGAMLGILAAVVVTIIVVAAVTVVLFKKGQTRKEHEQRVAGMGLTLQQYTDLLSLRQMIEAERDDASILQQAGKLLDTHRGSEAMARHVRSDVGAAWERETQRQRQKLRQQELVAWRTRSRQLEEEARQTALAEEERRKQELEAAKLRDKEDRERREREEIVRRIRQQIPELRQKSAELCRSFNFSEAKLLFAPAASAPDDEMSVWGAGQQKTIELANELFDLVRNGEEELKGERFKTQGIAQRVAITAIGITGISAEYREPTYDKGKYIGDRVEKVSLSFAELPAAQLVKLAETAALKKGMTKPETDLRVGAYLLSRNEDVRAVRHYLEMAAEGLPDEVAPMLKELEERQ